MEIAFVTYSVFMGMFTLFVFYGIIFDPEAITEDFDKFVFGMHRTFVEVWNKIQRIPRRFKKKPPVKYKDQKIGEVTKTEYTDGGLIATMRIDDDLIRKALSEGIGSSFSLGRDSLGHSYVERIDGTRQEIDIKTDEEKVRDGEMTINQARKNRGMPAFTPSTFESESFKAAAKKMGASVAMINADFERRRQARWTNCVKHRFGVFSSSPVFLNDKPTGINTLTFKCRRCGMPWEVSNFIFQKRGYIKGYVDFGGEPMDNVKEFVAVDMSNEKVCPVHNRNHRGWICIRKE